MGTISFTKSQICQIYNAMNMTESNIIEIQNKTGEFEMPEQIRFETEEISYKGLPKRLMVVKEAE